MTTQFQFRDRNYALNSQGQLTEKEEVEAASILLGLTYKESARQRGVSPETAKTQRASAKAKVGASSLPEFVMTVISKGWLRDFLKGLLRRAAQKARRRSFENDSQAHTPWQLGSTTAGLPTPLFTFDVRADFSFGRLTATQRAHLRKINAANAVRYIAYLAVREAHTQGGTC